MNAAPPAATDTPPLHAAANPALATAPPALLAAPAVEHAAGRGAARALYATWLLALLLLVAALAGGGIWLRQVTFPHAHKIYFRSDMINAWYWGSFNVTDTNQYRPRAAILAGTRTKSWSDFLRHMGSVYRRAAHMWVPWGRYRLDYPPGRLAVVSLWAWHERSLYPKQRWWRARLMGPMLWFNTAVELFGAVGFFLLVRYWVRRASLPPRPGPTARARFIRLRRSAAEAWRTRTLRPFAAAAPPAPAPTVTPAAARRAGWLGLLAAAIFWFNPAAIQSSHTWVQYDVWVIPFYVWAVYLGSIDCFALAGATLAVGSLLKGQELFVAPMLLLWPLFALRPARALELLVGFALCVGLLASPCFFATGADWLFLGCVLLAAVLACAWAFLQRRMHRKFALLFLLPALPLVLWPWFAGITRGSVLWVVPLLAWLALAPALLPLRRAWYLVATALALAIAVIALALPAHFLWLKTGYIFGTTTSHAWGKMALPNTSSLAAILGRRFHWHLRDIAFTLHLFGIAQPVTMRALLISLFAITLPLCAWGAARHAKRNDPRFLVAIITPWVTFFAFAPQMYERYLLWGGCMLVSVAVAVDFGLVLLGALLCLFSFSMTLATQLDVNPHTAPLLRRVIERIEPGIGYAIILAACICVYISLTRARRQDIA